MPGPHYGRCQAEGKAMNLALVRRTGAVPRHVRAAVRGRVEPGTRARGRAVGLRPRTLEDAGRRRRARHPRPRSATAGAARDCSKRCCSPSRPGATSRRRRSLECRRGDAAARALRRSRSRTTMLRPRARRRRGRHASPCGSVPDGEPQLVPGGAVADAVVGLDGDSLVLVTRGDEPTAALANLGDSPVRALVAVVGAARRRARGARDRRRGAADATESRSRNGGCSRRPRSTGWRGARSTSPPSTRASGCSSTGPSARSRASRIRWPTPSTDVEGARLLVWYAVWSIAQRTAGRRLAGPVRLRLGVAHAATRAVARALHTHGGYGLSLEYDVQLYHRRAKAWALVGGDPRDAFVLGAERRWDGTRASRSPRPAIRSSTSGTATPRRCGRSSRQLLRGAHHARGPRAHALQLGRSRLGTPPRAGRGRPALPHLAAASTAVRTAGRGRSR